MITFNCQHCDNPGALNVVREGMLTLCPACGCVHRVHDGKVARITSAELDDMPTEEMAHIADFKMKAAMREQLCVTAMAVIERNAPPEFSPEEAIRNWACGAAFAVGLEGKSETLEALLAACPEDEVITRMLGELGQMILDQTIDLVHEQLHAPEPRRHVERRRATGASRHHRTPRHRLH